MPITAFPYGVQGSPLIGGNLDDMFNGGGDLSKPNIFFVDGDLGSDTYDGLSPQSAKKTISAAIKVASPNATIYIKAKKMAAAATDPSNYAETIIIPATLAGVSLIGIGEGPAQGNVPQIKKGSGSVALLTIRAPGCVVANLGFNGGGSTGGGILLDDDGTTKTAFGTVIEDCHFKNCVGSTATSAKTGGAIQWSSNGGAWQVRIRRCLFYRNVGDIVLIGTAQSVPEDVVIEDNTFLGLASTSDCPLYLAGGSGMASVTVQRNYFAHVLPALGGGATVRYADLTGCTGLFTNNYFASTNTTTGFGAGKAAAKIPTTVGIAHCYSDGGLIVREP